MEDDLNFSTSWKTSNFNKWADNLNLSTKFRMTSAFQQNGRQP